TVGDAEPEPGGLHALRREEGLVRLATDRLRHAGAGVGDDEDGAVAFDARLQREPAALRHRVDGVEDEIDHGFAQRGGVALDRRLAGEAVLHPDADAARAGAVLPVAARWAE